jgi:hypothetical protein
MLTVRRFVLTCLGLALIGAALSGPVAAAGKARMTLVQGIPGTRVDVCLGAAEIVSGMPYGKVAVKSVAAGEKILRVHRAAAGTCTGSAIYGSAKAPMAPGSDKTIVLTRKEPSKILVFDNKAPVDTTVVTGGNRGWIIVRHAADVGPVAIRAAIDPTTFPWTPAADPAWSKGQSRAQDESIVGQSHVIIATPVDAMTALASTPVYAVKDLSHYEHILVGTSPANLRFINLQRSLPAPD